MKDNILKALTKNWMYKILALVFAFVLWLMVYNTEDPTRTETMTITISVINKESVAEMNKYFEVADGAGRITFTITAPRSIQEKLDERDFTAVADMEYLTIDEGGTTGSVPVELKCTSASLGESIKLNTTMRNMKVKLETLMSKQFIITAKAIGEVADGHALGTVDVSAPNVLKVSGPESVVERIESVVAKIDVTDMTMNVTDAVVPTLYDEAGKEIPTTRLTLSNPTVNVSANILKVKEVPIVVRPYGTPAEGYVVTEVTTNPPTIALKGSATVLNAISSIEIPSELIKVNGAMADIMTSIDIQDYIPYGAELLDPKASAVNVTVGIDKIREKTYTISTGNITVIGLPTDENIKFVYTNIAVTISGLEEDLELLTNMIIKGSIDVTGLSEGEHEIDLRLDLDEEKYTYSNIKVAVVIGKDPIAGDGNEGI